MGFSHIAVGVVAHSAIEVGKVAVLVPPGSVVGKCTVAKGDVIVRVHCGEGPTLVVVHSIA